MDDLFGHGRGEREGKEGDGEKERDTQKGEFKGLKVRVIRISGGGEETV